MSYETTPLWTRTLGATTAHADEVEQLRGAFKQFRSLVEPLAAEISQSMPGYTDHGIAHCDSLWSTASLLVDDGFPLNPAEAFVLGGAFLVHDLGMGLSAYRGGLSAILELDEFADALAASFPEDFQQIIQQATDETRRNPTWDALSNTQLKVVLTNFIRERHAERAVEIVSQAWETTDAEPFYLLADPALRSFYGDCIGRVARSHWVDVAELDSELPPKLGAVPGYPSSWTVDPVKLACILRLADAVNVDASRAHPLHTPHRMPQGGSAQHWHAQERLLSASIDNRRVYFTSGRNFGPDLAEAWWLTYDIVRGIDSELRRVDNLCADLDLPRFTAHAAAGAEAPARFARYVRAEGWQPIDARPFIGDQNLVMKQLGGSSLYGGSRRGEIALREILANALDASRALRSGYDDEPLPIEVRLTQSADGDVLSVRDYGIGIQADQVAYTLCNFGVSGWRGAAMRQAIPGLVSSGYRPTGQFGIGFFASFMAATRVRVTTRHVEAAKAETCVLEFPRGLDERPMLRPASRSEQMLKPGTKVELFLDVPADAPEGLLNRERPTSLSASSFCRFVRRLALTSDENIDARLGSNGELLRAVNAREWETADGEWLLDAMNSSLDLSSDMYVAMRNEVAPRLTTLQDGSGRTIARIALDQSTFAPYSLHEYVLQRSYSGGVQASNGGGPYIGVIEGPPTSAVRSDIDIMLTPDEMRTWFRGQIDLLDREQLSSTERNRIRHVALQLGVDLPNWELAWSKLHGGMVDADLRNWLKDLQSFRVVEGRYIEVPAESGASLRLYDSSDGRIVLVLDENSLIVEDEYGGYADWFVRDADEFAYLTAEADGEGVHPTIRWWELVRGTAMGQIIRLAAEVWSVPLDKLVENSYYSNPLRPHVESGEVISMSDLTGRDIQIGGWVIPRDDL